MAPGTDPEFADGDFEVWLEQGEASLLEDDCGEALRAFDEALALRPGDIQAASLRALALSGLDRFDEAIEAFSFVIRKAPDGPVGYIGRAGVLLQLRKSLGADACGPARVETALADFDAALMSCQENEGRETIHFLRGQFLTEIGAFSDAARDFEDAAELEPAATAYLFYLANARFAAGDQEGGEAATQKIVDLVEPQTKRGRSATPRPPAPRRPRPGRA